MQITTNNEIDRALRDIVQAMKVDENTLVRYMWRTLLNNLGSMYERQ